jgi:hypothetical protein
MKHWQFGNFKFFEIWQIWAIFFPWNILYIHRNHIILFRSKFGKNSPLEQTLIQTNNNLKRKTKNGWSPNDVLLRITSDDRLNRW